MCTYFMFAFFFIQVMSIIKALVSFQHETSLRFIADAFYIEFFPYTSNAWLTSFCVRLLFGNNWAVWNQTLFVECYIAKLTRILTLFSVFCISFSLKIEHIIWIFKPLSGSSRTIVDTFFQKLTSCWYQVLHGMSS